MGGVPRVDARPQQSDQLVEAHQFRALQAGFSPRPQIAGQRRQERSLHRLAGDLHLALAERGVRRSGVKYDTEASARILQRIAEEVGTAVHPEAHGDSAPGLARRHRHRRAEGGEDGSRMRRD